MKNRHRVNFVCAISITLVGCGTSGLGEINKYQAAPLMTDCLDNSTSYIYNNEQKEFSTASINLDMPKPNDLTYIAKSIKSYLSNETESLKEYQSTLKKNPLVKIARVNLTSLNDKISCDYIYLTDKNNLIIQQPLLYKITGPHQTHYINSEQLVQEISPIEYLFELPKSQHGIRLFHLNFTDQVHKVTVNNSDVLNRISNVIASNSLLEFYDLDKPIQDSLAIELANSATTNLKIPTFVPQNPIYITPSLKSKPMTSLDIADDENINAKQMDQYNNERYVDATTGINTTRHILNQMRQELGIGDDRYTVGGKQESTQLSINTNNFTREEIQQGNRQMQQEQEKKWGKPQ